MRSAINQDVVEQPGPRRQYAVTRSRQQGDMVAGVMLANRRHWGERLDEVAEGTELNDQNAAPSRRGFRRRSLWPQSGQTVEVDMPGQLLKRAENRRVPVRIKRADGDL